MESTEKNYVLKTRMGQSFTIQIPTGPNLSEVYPTSSTTLSADPRTCSPADCPVSTWSLCSVQNGTCDGLSVVNACLTTGCAGNFSSTYLGTPVYLTLTNNILGVSPNSADATMFSYMPITQGATTTALFNSSRAPVQFNSLPVQLLLVVAPDPNAVPLSIQTNPSDPNTIYPNTPTTLALYSDKGCQYCSSNPWRVANASETTFSLISTYGSGTVYLTLNSSNVIGVSQTSYNMFTYSPNTSGLNDPNGNPVTFGGLPVWISGSPFAVAEKSMPVSVVKSGFTQTSVTHIPTSTQVSLLNVKPSQNTASFAVRTGKPSNSNTIYVSDSTTLSSYPSQGMSYSPWRITNESGSKFNVITAYGSSTVYLTVNSSGVMGVSPVSGDLFTYSPNTSGNGSYDLRDSNGKSVTFGGLPLWISGSPFAVAEKSMPVSVTEPGLTQTSASPTSTYTDRHNSNMVPALPGFMQVGAFVDPPGTFTSVIQSLKSTTTSVDVGSTLTFLGNIQLALDARAGSVSKESIVGHSVASAYLDDARVLILAGNYTGAADALRKVTSLPSTGYNVSMAPNPIRLNDKVLRNKIKCNDVIRGIEFVRALVASTDTSTNSKIEACKLVSNISHARMNELIRIRGRDVAVEAIRHASICSHLRWAAAHLVIEAGDIDSYLALALKTATGKDVVIEDPIKKYKKKH
jgi:hypothetical protein